MVVLKDSIAINCQTGEQKLSECLSHTTSHLDIHEYGLIWYILVTTKFRLTEFSLTEFSHP